MRTSTIAIVIAIFAFVGGLVWYQNQASEPADQTATKASTSTVPGDWSEYSAAGLSFSHPSSAEISMEAGRIKIQILGENNEPNTEVTDGITAYMSTTTSADGLRAVAERVFADRRDTSQETVASTTQAEFAGKSGYAFALRNQLGGVTNYRIAPTNQTNTAVVANFSVAGEEPEAYVNTFADIVRSVRVKVSQSEVEDKTPSENASTSSDAKDNDSLAQACQQAGGNWLAEHTECEGVQQNWCTQQGGSYNNCASACRHNPDAEFCTQQCVLVCSF